MSGFTSYRNTSGVPSCRDNYGVTSRRETYGVTSCRVISEIDCLERDETDPLLFLRIPTTEGLTFDYIFFL